MMIKLPIFYGTELRYRGLTKNPGHIYIITNARYNEPTLYFGRIPLSRERLLGVGGSVIVEHISLNDATLELVLHYSDNTEKIISLTSDRFIDSVSYDDDAHILTFNGNIHIDLSNIVLETTNVISKSVNSQSIPLTNAVINYIEDTPLDDTFKIFLIIANELKLKNYKVDSDDFVGIMKCIINKVQWKTG